MTVGDILAVTLLPGDQVNSGQHRVRPVSAPVHFHWSPGVSSMWVNTTINNIARVDGLMGITWIWEQLT